MKESINLELKSIVNDKIIKEIIAFANSDGGRILVGYNDDGSLCGVQNSEKELEKIATMMHDNIEPDVSFITKLEIIRVEDKDTIVITVFKGTNKPYFISSKGLTPKGVYIRNGNTSTQATQYSIREMIMKTANISFEENTSKNQNLTFNYAEMIFKTKGISFSEKEYKTLGISDDEGMFTNLGLIISDQCPYVIKIATFENEAKTTFIDKQEIGNESILAQLDDTLKFLNVINKTRAEIIGIERIETPDYNVEVLREGVLNFIAHRDYDNSSYPIINIYPDKIEMHNPGGLIDGLTLEDIELGASRSRNPKLVSILHRLHFIEAYGTGIPRILDAYSGTDKLPQIKIAPNTFLIEIPKSSRNNNLSTIRKDNSSMNNSNEDTLSLTNEEKLIMYLKENERCYRDDIERIYGVKTRTSQKIIKDLIARNVICKIGKTNGSYYTLNSI